MVPLLTSRWDIGVTLLPSTDSEVETHVVTDQGTMHFQEWWTRHRAALPALAFDFVGVSSAVPAPGVLAALADADVVLLAPSNPVVSIGAILAIPGMTPALRDTSAPVVGVSPIISGAVVRGMADACLTTIGVETSASAVALHYGARSAGGVIDGWLVDTADDAALAPMTSAGITARAVPLWLSDDATRAQVARDAVELALSL